MNELKKIIELEETEKKNWLRIIQTERKKHIKEPNFYIKNAIQKINQNNISKNIQEIRDISWNQYTQDEINFYKQVIKILIEKKYPSEVFDFTVNASKISHLVLLSKEEIFLEIKEIFGNFTALIFPYLYELSKSVTQSRRSRAGKSFEAIVQYLMEQKKIPYHNQSKIGSTIFKNLGLGKIVDGIVPSIEHYQKNRSKCMILTMKTTLRERWQEVIEELNRTKIPSIYLLTLDEAISSNTLDIMKEHNITIVVYDFIKAKHQQHTNIISFEELFEQEIKHILSGWGNEFKNN